MKKDSFTPIFNNQFMLTLFCVELACFFVILGYVSGISGIYNFSIQGKDAKAAAIISIVGLILYISNIYIGGLVRNIMK